MFGVGQRDVDNFRAEVAKFGDGFFHGVSHARINAVAEVFARQAELHAFDAIMKRGEVIRHRDIERGRIEWIESGDRLQDHRCVFDALREWSDLVE